MTAKADRGATRIRAAGRRSRRDAARTATLRRQLPHRVRVTRRGLRVPARPHR